ncbi:hypothetical protein KAS10_04050, partial [Candidatus Aerophobetes bacterium]|nr:hypothetical protein [Candidatus Aerophobetes bacterium]
MKCSKLHLGYAAIIPCYSGLMVGVDCKLVRFESSGGAGLLPGSYPMKRGVPNKLIRDGSMKGLFTGFRTGRKRSG